VPTRHFRTRILRTLAGLLALSMLAVACGDDGDDATAPAGEDEGDGGGGGAEDEPCTEERAGGSLTMGTASAAQGMSPYVVAGTGNIGGDYMSAFYDTLMRYDATTGEFEPNVAESLEPNDDFTQWTLTLRPDVRFGNGDPLTTADVVAHIEKMKTARVRAAGMAVAIQAMQVVDDRTMVFDVGEPWGTFPYVLATEPGWIPSRRAVQERGDDGLNADATGAGVGPYELQRFAPGEELVLTAKDDYWGGPVCIETLQFQFIPGAEATYEAFQQGEFDAAFVAELPVVAEAREADDIGFEAGVGAERYVMTDQGITGRTDTPFTDVRVREAMQLAVDYDAINERVYGGVGITTSALVPEDSPLWHGVEGPPYDPDRAAELVEELEADGTWDGTIDLLVASDDPTTTEAGVLFEGLWEAVGMDVTIEQVTQQELLRRTIAEPNFEVAMLGFAILDPAPWSTVNGLASDSPRSRTAYASPAMDDALAQLRAAADNEETTQALGAMQEVWNEEFPLIVFSHTTWAVLVADHVHGMEYGPDMTPYFHRAWVE
jgi:peptide/nickel transport system substrate-binding protein